MQRKLGWYLAVKHKKPSARSMNDATREASKRNETRHPGYMEREAFSQNGER